MGFFLPCICVRPCFHMSPPQMQHFCCKSVFQIISLWNRLKLFDNAPFVLENVVTSWPINTNRGLPSCLCSDEFIEAAPPKM